jgi:hypothetical protein
MTKCEAGVGGWRVRDIPLRAPAERGDIMWCQSAAGATNAAAGGGASMDPVALSGCGLGSKPELVGDQIAELRAGQCTSGIDNQRRPGAFIRPGS